MENLVDELQYTEEWEAPIKIERKERLDYVNNTWENYRGSEEFYRDKYKGLSYIPNVFKIMEDYTNGKIEQQKETYKRWSLEYQKLKEEVIKTENEFYKAVSEKNMKELQDKLRKLTIYW